MEDLRGQWPFSGRAAELGQVRESLGGGRRGIVVCGAAGTGRSRLAAEAVAGLAHVWVTGTRGGASLRFGAFAHLLPGAAADSLSRAVETLRWVRVLVVDDAHLLDDASAALVQHLAVHRRAGLLLTVTTPGRLDETAASWCPDAVSGLWRRHVLPRLTIGPLSEERTAEVLTSVLGDHVEALTVRRLHRLSGGNLLLLRELAAATREAGTLERLHGVWRWRGEVPMTGRLRELVAAAIGELGEAEREALELVAFGEPLPAAAAPVPVAALERLEARGLIVSDDDLLVRLAHPLFGPAVRAGVGRLRAQRLSRTARAAQHAAVAAQCPEPAARPAEPVTQAAARTTEPAARTTELTKQCAELAARGYAGDLARIAPGAGERLVEDDTGWDEAGMAEFCARRAWIARLRGEVREAVSWSGEGLRRDPGNVPCLGELARAAACAGDLLTAEEALDRCPDDASARAWVLAARGDLDGALRSALAAAEGGDLFALHDVARLGAPGMVAARLDRLAETMSGDLAPLLAEHAAALVAGDAAALDKVARKLAELGLLLHAAEAAGHAAKAHRAHREGRAADASLAHAAMLAHVCQGARTPTLVDLATPRLTPRQRQIAGLAAAGLTNREIAERLGLSIRTVANQLCRMYEHLGSSDRTALGRLISLTYAAPMAVRDHPVAW
ncbi:helix-turn-helix transcriptional regulator [Planotetraspora sp. A-T 1434]|uniref:helix-turn-helix domain-containing protein n=1 Tax=Planotetraspora sp. A-T 1434 TaxID=2979219 RepID=UPI0021BE30C6|nr:helix-turn-helix transcriptional regulator [Planotetraspora sp. A-T 1434]MCT9934383.1 helix-turn-helix transcriptional regulator [Planotetraspora sp. A-T 1434]